MDLNIDVLRLKLLLNNMPQGILFEDKNRKIAQVNKSFIELFQIPASPEQLIGVDCAQSAEQSKLLFEDSENFVSKIEKVLNDRKEIFGDILNLKDGRIWKRDYMPVFKDNSFEGNLWIYQDITSEYKKEQDLVEQKSELEKINKFMVNREQRIIELKEELENLKAKK